MHKVIVIPGLNDHIGITKKAISGWVKLGLEPIVFRMGWNDKESFEDKLEKLSVLVYRESQDGSRVSVIGCSAGGSVALNLLMRCPNVLNKSVSICGRLRKGKKDGFRSFKSRTKKSDCFKQSVELLESSQTTFSPSQLERIMTIRPFFGDELVPATTAILKGAHNITIPTLGHSFSIYAALSFLSKPLISFIKEETDK